MYFPKSEYRSDATAQPQFESSGGVFLDQQNSRINGIFVCSFFGGATLMTAALLGIAAYRTSSDPVPALVIGGFFGLSGTFFIAYACGIANRLLRFMHNSETIIKSQDIALRSVDQNSWLHVRREGEASGGGALQRGSASPDANAFPINFKPSGRFH